MGNINSALLLSSSIDNYLSEIEGFKYKKKSLGKSLFLKTICCKHEEGLVVVKIYIKESLNINLEDYIKELEDVKQQLNKIPNVLAFQQITETDKAGYLIRQYFPNNLYDRISTRPLLDTNEMKWISFQLLIGLSEAHKRGIVHGDIKTENIMVTSWNWIYLSDFEGFKPAYLPEDNPEWFSFFFDSSKRRTCYIAPERFYASDNILLQPEIIKDGKLTAEMDIFSLGCVIAELFLEGSSIFSFSQLLKYRDNKYDPSEELEKIKDIHIRSLIKDMIQLNPKDRKSIDFYLEHWKGKAFPNYFYDFLHQYISSFTDLSLYSNSDNIIERIYKNFEEVIESISLDGYVNNNIIELLEFLENDDDFNLEKELQKLKFEFVPIKNNLLRMHDGGCQILISYICSNIRNVIIPSSKIYALNMLFFLSLCISDQYKLDQVLPYLLKLLQDDENTYVKMNAIQKLVKLLQTVRSISPENINIFTDYIYPYLKPLSKDPDVLIRATYAKHLSDIANIASRFIKLSYMYIDDNLCNSNGFDSKDYYQQENCDEKLNSLREIIGKDIDTLLIDSSAYVKQALLSNISEICIFLGEQKTIEKILKRLIIYLNDQENWILRNSFWKYIVGIGAFIGTKNISKWIIPLMIPALYDKEEFNVAQLLKTITSFSELKLLQKNDTKKLAIKIIPLLYHPNIYIRLCTISFISSLTKSFSPENFQFLIYPQIKPYLSINEDIELNKKALFNYLKPALKREYFDFAINILTSNSNNVIDIKNNINQSDFTIKADDILSVEDVQKFYLIKNYLKLSEEDEQKLNFLKYYLKLLQKQNKIEQNNDSNEIIDLRNYGAILYTVFIEPPTDLHSYDENNDILEKNITHLNDISSQDMKFYIKNKCSGINRNSIDCNLKQKAYEFFPPEINLGKVVSYPSLITVLNSKQRNMSYRNLQSECDWKPEGILISSICEHSSKINQLCISSDNAFIGSCSNDGTLKIWNCNRIKENVTNRSILSHDQGGKVTSISFCENRHSVISASDNGSIHISRIEYMSNGGHLKSEFKRVREMVLDDGEYITNINHYNTELQSVVVMSSSQGSIYGFDLRIMKTVWKLDSKPNYGYISAFAVNPSNYWLCSGTSKGVMTLWDIRFSLPVNSWAHPSLTKIDKMKLFPSSSNINLNESKQVLCAVNNGNNELSSWNVETKECTEIWCSEKFNSKKFYENGLKAVEPERACSNSSVRTIYNSINSFTFLENSNYYRLQLPFIVSVGSDKRIRYWDQIDINRSMILNGADIGDQNISYRTNQNNSIKIHYESFDSLTTLNGSNSSPLNFIDSAPLHYSNYNSMSNKINDNMDSITDVTYTVVPYPLVITSRNDGIINIWK